MSDNLLMLLEMIEEVLAPEIDDSEILDLVKQIKIKGYDITNYLETHTPISLGKNLTIYTPEFQRGAVSIALSDAFQKRYPDLDISYIRNIIGKGVKIKLGRKLIKNVRVKPIRGSGIQNKGDVAEGLLGAALTVAFIKGGVSVKVDEVEDFLIELNAKDRRERRNKKAMIEKSLTKNVDRPNGTNDRNTCVIRLTVRNFEDLMDIRKRPALQSLLMSVTEFANSNEVLEASKAVATNEQNNQIAVVSDGVSNQKSTKVDVKTYLDGKITPLGKISLKATTTDQLGQVGGSWEGMSGMFKKMFNIELDAKYKSAWQAVMNERPRDKERVAEVAKEIYKDATEQINIKLAPIKPQDPTEDLDFIKIISNGLKYQVALEEEGVILIQLNKDTFKRMDFNNLENIIRQNKIEFKAFFVDDGRPKILIKDISGGGTLFQIRFRFDSGGVRQYVEKGPLVSELL